MSRQVNIPGHPDFPMFASMPNLLSRWLNRFPIGIRVAWMAVSWVVCGGPGVVRGAETGSAAGSVHEPVFTPEQRNHWAFQPVRASEPPSVRSRAWISNPVDAFVAARLEAGGIEPGPMADRVTLLRRVTLDLTGLPPTPEEVSAFLSDASPDAYSRVVSRLLASPRYGERWARHWLDVARYAESEGFKADETRPNAWRYRDYVIRALNDDKPFDRFVAEQIAGDELWPDDPDARIATGFNRHYPDESNARNLVQRRQEILNDVTDTVGYAFIGLSFACARCHDHKWDPISQADYFRLQSFFANTTAADALPLASEAERAGYERRLAVWSEATREIRDELERLEKPGRKAILDDYIEKYPDEIRAMLARPEPERTPFERQMVAKAMLYLDPKSHQFIADSAAAAGRLRGAEKERWTELRGQLKRLAHLHPGELPAATGMTDLGVDCPPTRVLVRGNWNSPGEVVEPAFPAALGSTRAEVRPVRAREGAGSSGRRTALARWLTDPVHPLVVRVMVNRVWHHHFGRGLVGTPSDFGLKGDKPTHPELLDWLARDFVAHGWSLKHLHARIVTSSTYRQSSAHRPEAAMVDRENRWLGWFPRRRLEGEALRDSMLSVSGRLNPSMGGPSVFPELPPGSQTRGGWRVTEEISERDRRSVYVFVRRNFRYPMFEAFDMPDTHESCARRNITTSPVQALTLLNDAMTLDWARSFAGRVLGAGPEPLERVVERVWQLAYSRLPAADEVEMALTFLRRRIEGQGTAALGGADPTVAAVTDLCHAAMLANEFVTLN